MTVDEAFRRISSLAIDTSPFIYYVENNPNYIERMDAIFQLMNVGIQFITSVITLTEVLVMPFSTNQTHFEQEYREMLLNTEDITSVEVSSSIAELAARLRAKYRLRTPDAIQIATAVESGCDAFLTNDLGLRRVTEILVLVLDELELTV